MVLVHKWLYNQGGKLVYSPTEKFKGETRSPRIRSFLKALSEAGKLKQVSSRLVEEKQRTLSGLKSDDPHIIALALVAGVKVLISHDTSLHKDFSKKVRGKIYQNAKHKHLLRKDTCP